MGWSKPHISRATGGQSIGTSAGVGEEAGGERDPQPLLLRTHGQPLVAHSRRGEGSSLSSQLDRPGHFSVRELDRGDLRVDGARWPQLAPIQHDILDGERRERAPHRPPWDGEQYYPAMDWALDALRSGQLDPKMLERSRLRLEGR